MERGPATTDPAIDRAVEDPTDVDPAGARMGARSTSFRDERTAAAETRTVKWAQAAPWLSTPEPEPRPQRPRDPLFWPAVVFVGVLAVSIAFLVLSPTRGRSNAAHPSGSFTSP